MEMMQGDEVEWILQSCLKPLMVLRHGFCRKKRGLCSWISQKTMMVGHSGNIYSKLFQIKHHQNPSNNYSFNGLGFSLSNFSPEGRQPRSQFEILRNRGLELAFSSILQAEFRSSFASIKCTHLNNLNMEVSFAHSWKINIILIENTDLQNTRKKMITWLVVRQDSSPHNIDAWSIVQGIDLLYIILDPSAVKKISTHSRTIQRSRASQT